MWVLLNRAPTSTNLISTSTQLHPPPPSSSQYSPSSLQHPQQYSNQNIARNWAVSPNLGQKNQSFLTENWHTWYTGGSDSEFRLIFLKLWPKINFWANLGPKSQSCLFCMKIGTYDISRMSILFPTLVFWISYQRSIFKQTWTWKLADMAS